MEYFKDILTILVSTATVTGLVIWYFKEEIKGLLQLKQQKFSRLQTEQFDTIKIVFKNLNEVNELLDELIVLVKNDIEICKSQKEIVVEPIVTKIFETQRHFRQNKIFLKQELVKKIENTINELFYCLTTSAFALIVKSKEVYSQDGKYLGIEIRKLNEVDSDDACEFKNVLDKIDEIKQNSIPSTLKDIEKEFRKIFGLK